MLTKAATKPSRAELADAALRAATELGIMINENESSEPKLDRISQFREVLHHTTEGWLEAGSARLTDAMTARLYFDALEQPRNGIGSSVDDFLAKVRDVLKNFDDFDQRRSDPAALREMMKFALALHTLLIGEAYGRISHWKHKELL